MNELANKVQIVMNTIEDLEIKSTYNNMNRLMGALTVLKEIRDTLANTPDVIMEGTENGKPEAE